MVNQAKYSIRFIRRDKRGQTLALAAVSLVAVFAVGALAVDLGLAFAARAAAQRAADSAALAGASAFIDFNFSTQQAEAEAEAEARAYEYALRNDVLARAVDSSQVTVWVIPDTQKVRVRIAAADLPSWFARFLGVLSMDVAAQAAAMASDGGMSNQCVLPVAMNDIWHTPEEVDLNTNRIPDNGEEWVFDPERDAYLTYKEPIPSELLSDYQDFEFGTGLGSTWRNPRPGAEHIGGGGIPEILNDRGRRIWIKDAPKGQSGKGSGGDAGGTDVMVGPGNFRIWEMPDIEQDCQGRPGANWVKENIVGCNACDVFVAPQEYETQTGNIASIKDGLQNLVDTDPGAYWDEGTQSIQNSIHKNPEEQSERVRIVPLWDPAQVLQGKSTIRFNNFAKIFVEESGIHPPDFAIYVRFLGTISGGSAGPNTGSLVKYLRLVE